MQFASLNSAPLQPAPLQPAPLRRGYCCLRTRGQSCVEAAFLLPVLLVFLLVLLQPALMLYHALILENTCQEACRVLATCSNDQDMRALDSFITHRLQALPAFFAASDDADEHPDWSITTQGNAASREVGVTIEGQVRALPLVGGLFAGSFGASSIPIKISRTLVAHANWETKQGIDASSSAGAWY